MSKIRSAPADRFATRSSLALVSLLLFSLIAYRAPLGAQGIIIGRVVITDASTPLPGTIIRVIGTVLGAQADSTGTFRIVGVPSGLHQLEARSLGHTIARAEVFVRSDATVRVEFRLSPAPNELAGVLVVGGAADALSRIPGSAVAIGTKQLQAQQPISANEVLRTVAGVHVTEEEGSGLRANIGIRGLDPDRSRSVLVLEDGIPIALAPYGEPELYYSPPIDRMSRVEVIKGSGSILFGPQTIGGVVNYVTSEPSVTPSGRFEARGGGGGQQFAKAQFGGSRGGGRGLISAFGRRAADLNGLSYDVRDVTGKVGVRTKVGDVSAKVSVYDEESNATYVGLTDSLFRAAPRTHPSPGDRLVIQRQAATVSHEIGFGAATLRTTIYGYHTARDWTRRDYTYGPTGGTHVFANSTGSRDRSFDVGGIEPRFRTLWSLGEFTSELDAGVRYHRERAHDTYLLGTAGGTTSTVRDDEVRNGEATSAWLQNRVSIHPTLHLTPGIRVERFSYDRQIRRARVRRATPTGSTRAIEDVDIRSSDDVRELIPGFGAAWTPTVLVTLFAGAHRGFAPPRTKDALIYTDPTLAPDAQVPDPVSLELEAERSWNYEIGTRIVLRSYLSIEATAFYLDFTNQIIEPSLSAGSASAAALANQGSTRHQGVEIGGRFDIGGLVDRPLSLALEGNYTFARAVFADDRYLRNGADTLNVRGNALPYAPLHRVHAAITFEHPVGLRSRLDGTFVGSQFTDNFETVIGTPNGRVGRIAAYQILDLSLQYDLRRLPGVRLVGSVKNLADRNVVVSRRPEGIKVGLPRLVSLGVSWEM